MSTSTFPNKDMTLAVQRRQVFDGRATKTRGGLTAGNLMESNSGRIVSKKRSTNGKKYGSKNLTAWRKALEAACNDEGVNYTIPKKGTSLYKRAKAYYASETPATPKRKAKATAKATPKQQSECNKKKKKDCKDTKDTKCTWVKGTRGSRMPKGYCRSGSKKA